MSERGHHLGDGAYIVPDPYGTHQLWFSANHHVNRVVALGPAAFEEMARWIKNWAPPAYVEALERGLK